MASVIRVGQSKFASAPIDEDSSERIMNCIETLSELEAKPVVHELFLKDTKIAYSKMLNAQEVCPRLVTFYDIAQVVSRKRRLRRKSLKTPSRPPSKSMISCPSASSLKRGQKTSSTLVGFDD